MTCTSKTTAITSQWVCVWLYRDRIAQLLKQSNYYTSHASANVSANLANYANQMGTLLRSDNTMDPVDNVAFNPELLTTTNDHTATATNMELDPKPSTVANDQMAASYNTFKVGRQELVTSADASSISQFDLRSHQDSMFLEEILRFMERWVTGEITNIGALNENMIKFFIEKTKIHFKKHRSDIYQGEYYLPFHWPLN